MFNTGIHRGIIISFYGAVPTKLLESFVLNHASNRLSLTQSPASVLSITERSVRRQSAVRTMLADHREYQYTKLALAGATAKKKPPKDFSRSGFFSTIRLKGAT